MDYDSTTMPAVYDAGRGYSRQTLDLWLAAIAAAAGRSRAIETILDLGCGTGRYAGALADHFGAAVVAVDPSQKMLAEARSKNARNVTYLRGAGESLPLGDASVDMVFMSMVFHHFAQPLQVARECRRVLKAGGVAVMRVGATERVDAYPYVPFFPRTKDLIRRTLTSLDAVTATFRDAGFEPSAHEVVMSETAESWTEYAGKVALRADSILIQLSDAEFAAGLEDLRSFAAAQPRRQPVIEPVDLLAFRRD
jgi:ubiquinone/menaquinone biosynthesis C-methylase UbiE